MTTMTTLYLPTESDKSVSILAPTISMVASASCTATSDISLHEFLDGVRDGRWRAEVEAVRAAYREGGKAAAAPLKKRLPAVMGSGQFSRRKSDALLAHSGCIILDIDDVDDVDAVKAQLMGKEYVAFYFTSPSANGIKIGVRVPADGARHAQSWKAARAYIKSITGLDCDEAAKDTGRLCFVSYDEDLYSYLPCEELPVEEESGWGTNHPPTTHSPTLTLTAPAAITSAGASRKQIAEQLLGPVTWTDSVTGFAECPGRALHTSGDGERDCKVFLSGAPSVTCFHNSCRSAIDTVNLQLRRQIGITEGTATALYQNEVGSDIQSRADNIRSTQPPPTLTHLSWESLLEPVSYEDNLLGDRFLERGQGLILFGPAGCGKSVAGLQMVAHWACGQPGLHIRPAKPLRVVVLQTEDSVNDLRETLAGILSVLPPDMVALVKQNLFIPQNVHGGTGEDLRQLLEAACTTYQPDLVICNPLLAWCATDPTKELGGLLYQTIDPVIKRHRVGFAAVHHTTKTGRADTSHYGAHDHQYSAAGDARVANWPRAMLQIEPMSGPGYYRFRLAKRGRRAQWTWDLKPVTERYFKHGQGSVRWLDCSPEEAQKAEAADTYHKLLPLLPGPDEEPKSRDWIREQARKAMQKGKDICDSWLRLAIEAKAVETIRQLSPESRRWESKFRRVSE